MLTKKYQAVRERSRILEDVLMQNKYAVYEERWRRSLFPPWAVPSLSPLLTVLLYVASN